MVPDISMFFRKKMMAADIRLDHRISNARRALENSTSEWSKKYWTKVLSRLESMRSIAAVFLAEDS